MAAEPVVVRLSITSPMSLFRWIFEPEGDGSKRFVDELAMKNDRNTPPLGRGCAEYGVVLRRGPPRESTACQNSASIRAEAQRRRFSAQWVRHRLNDPSVETTPGQISAESCFDLGAAVTVPHTSAGICPDIAVTSLDECYGCLYERTVFAGSAS